MTPRPARPTADTHRTQRHATVRLLTGIGSHKCGETYTDTRAAAEWLIAHGFAVSWETETDNELARSTQREKTAKKKKQR